MSDFERTFGAGADVTSIIDGFNRSFLRDQEESFNEDKQLQKQWFPTFQLANAWLKQNPGRVITRSPDGDGFIEK